MEDLDRNVDNSSALTDERDMARALIEMIGGDAWSGKAAALEAAYGALARMFPRSKWTRRRVKGLFQKETATVNFREMRELAEAAIAEEARHEMLRKAREEHAQFITETARLASMALSRAQDRNRQMAAQ